MDRIKFLAQRIDVAKAMRKKWEDREKEWKAELQLLLDEEVETTEKDFFFLPQNTGHWPTENAAREYFANRFGQMYRITSIELNEEAWLIEYEKLPQYHSVQVEVDGWVVGRKSYVVKDDIDIKILERLIDPDEYKRVTRQVVGVELDPEAVKNWIEADSTALHALTMAAKAGDPRTRIDVKKVEEEE